MPCQYGYPDEMSPRGRMVFPRAQPEGKPSSRGEIFHQDTHTGMAYLFYYTEQTPRKISMVVGRSSENGGRFAGGHDGMANLCKPIKAYDFHVRYNNIGCSSLLNYLFVMKQRIHTDNRAKLK